MNRELGDETNEIFDEISIILVKLERIKQRQYGEILKTASLMSKDYQKSCKDYESITKVLNKTREILNLELRQELYTEREHGYEEDT